MIHPSPPRKTTTDLHLRNTRPSDHVNIAVGPLPHRYLSKLVDRVVRHSGTTVAKKKNKRASGAARFVPTTLGRPVVRLSIVLSPHCTKHLFLLFVFLYSDAPKYVFFRLCFSFFVCLIFTFNTYFLIFFFFFDSARSSPT